MRPRRFDFDPANANLTGFLSNATGATWTLTTTDSGDSLAHQVSIRNDAATDHSLKTALLTGTDADGRTQTETINLPVGSATVESTKYFLTLLTIVPSATIGADTMDIGWVDEFASKTIPLDFYRQAGPLVGLNVTGTISIDVELTNDSPYDSATFADQSAYLWINDDNLAAIVADSHGSISDWPVRALRFVVNSYTDTAEFQATLTQSFSNAA